MARPRTYARIAPARAKAAGRVEGLPLQSLGLKELERGGKPTRLDRLWSQASRYVFDGSHEWYYLCFPFLDYWLHFRGKPTPGWGLGRYPWRFLKVEGLRDLWLRSRGKARRLFGIHR